MNNIDRLVGLIFEMNLDSENGENYILKDNKVIRANLKRQSMRN